jgi:2-haloacid dehalogenase
MPIKAVVFDIGQVLHLWDPRHLYRKIFTAEAKMEDFLANICTHDWNAQMDRGKDWDEAVKELMAIHPAHADDIHAYHERWEEMAPDAIWGTVAIKNELQAAGYPLYVISNYSRAKLDTISKRFPFLIEFDGMIVSGDEGFIKPEPKIYQLLFERYGLEPETLLFIDDRPENIAAAEALGMKGILFRSSEQLRQELIRLGFPLQDRPATHCPGLNK